VFNILEALKSGEHRQAWLVAIAADLIQIVALPFFVAGGLSPLDDILDVAVGAILVQLLGWHWAFLPSFLVELTPGFDLFPTWTAAVFFVTSRRTSVEATGDRPAIVLPGQGRILPFQ